MTAWVCAHPGMITPDELAPDDELRFEVHVITHDLAAALCGLLPSAWTTTDRFTTDPTRVSCSDCYAALHPKGAA